MRILLFLFLLSPAFSPAVARAQHPLQFGDLRYRRLVDEITDADRSLVYTEEVAATIARTGSVTQRVGRVVWRCNGGDIEFFLRADSLPSDSSHIRWRVDDLAPSHQETWLSGTSGMSIFAPHESAESLALQSKRGERLVVRLKSPDGVDYDYTFSLEGAHDAMELLGCDPDGHEPGPTTDEAGTTQGMRGWYRSNRLIEEQWVYAPPRSLQPGSP